MGSGTTPSVSSYSINRSTSAFLWTIILSKSHEIIFFMVLWCYNRFFKRISKNSKVHGKPFHKVIKLDRFVRPNTLEGEDFFFPITTICSDVKGAIKLGQISNGSSTLRANPSAIQIFIHIYIFFFTLFTTTQLFEKQYVIRSSIRWVVRTHTNEKKLSRNHRFLGNNHECHRY